MGDYRDYDTRGSSEEPRTRSRSRSSGASGRTQNGAEKRRSSGNSASGDQQRRRRSGKSQAVQGKKIPWQRRVRRFWRRLRKQVRRLVRRIRRLLPMQAWLIIGAIAAAVVVILIIAAIVSAVRGGSGKTDSSDQTAVEESADESEAASDAAESEGTQTDETGETTDDVAILLQGIVDYTLITDETTITTLTSSYSETVPSSCTASSVLTGSSGTVFGTDNLFDDDLTTSWQEGEDDDGIGVTLTSTFSSGTEIIGIAFWPGNEKAQENFEANNRPETITVSVSSGGEVASTTYTLEDLMGEQLILYDAAVPAESVVIRIDSVYEGTSYDDTVIAELKFLTE